MCVSKITIIGSDNGLSPDRRQVIIWTNFGILLIQIKRTTFSEILSEIYTFSFKKMHLKKVVSEMAAILSRPQCVNNWPIFIIESSTFNILLFKKHCIQYISIWKNVLALVKGTWHHNSMAGCGSLLWANTCSLWSGIKSWPGAGCLQRMVRRSWQQPITSLPYVYFRSHLDILQGSFRLCNWLSLQCLVSWINHLPPACWSTFWKSTFKQQLGCRFDITYSISSFFCILTYAIAYVLIHHTIFRLYLYFLNNVLYFFKYSFTNVLHKRGLYTFYK